MQQLVPFQTVRNVAEEHPPERGVSCEKASYLFSCSSDDELAMFKKFLSTSSSDLPGQLRLYESAEQQPLQQGYFSSVHGSHSPVPRSPQSLAQSPLPAVSIDRPALTKSLRHLESLLIALDEFRELSDLLTRAQKRVTKATRDLSYSLKETIPKDRVEKDVIRGYLK